MPSNAGSDNDTSTLAATLSSAATTAAVAQPTKFPPPGFRPTYPNPRPTVSLDARPIVIPILSCVFSFPVLAFAIICALRYRAQRLRRRDQIRRLQGVYWWRSEYVWNKRRRGDVMTSKGRSTSSQRETRHGGGSGSVGGVLDDFLETSYSDRGSQWPPGGESFSLEWRHDSAESLANSPGIDPPTGAISAAITLANQNVISHFAADTVMPTEQLPKSP